MSTVGSLAGRSPLSAAAACIYMASHLMNESRSPREIAAVAQVSDGTIRTAYKLLHPEISKLIDPAWLGEGKGDLSRLPQV
jgi:transcription initiation factor TFIIB